MPEGMEWLVEAWPRFEDDAPLGRGDEVMTSDGAVRAEELSLTICDKEGGVTSIDFGERVKRPVKVLDADGVEIELGDNLYSVEGGLKFHVGCIDTRNGKIATAEMFAIDKWADPSLFTHRAPVLAADGKTLREGETVFDKDTGDRFEVNGFSDDGFVVCWDLDKCEADIEIKPSQLTHERPVADTWERLEDDATISPEAYCVKRGIDFSDVDGQHRVLDEVTERMARDLVRRARALVERDA